MDKQLQQNPSVNQHDEPVCEHDNLLVLLGTVIGLASAEELTYMGTSTVRRLDPTWIKLKQCDISFIVPQSTRRRLGDLNNDFAIWIMVCGGFPIKAIITTKNGQEFEKDYSFSFKSKFEDAQAKGISQVMECG